MIKLISSLMLSFCLLVNCANAEESSKYVEGKHYQSISQKILESKDIKANNHLYPNDIHVVEFFNYACHFCSELHPVMHEWSLKIPKDVEFHRVPVVFAKPWEVLAKAYYTAELLGKLDLMDNDFFVAVHRKHMNLANETILKNFFQQYDVSNEQFDETYQSFAISRKLKLGKDLVQTAAILATPSVMVYNDKVGYLTDSNMVNDPKELTNLLSYLINKSKQA